ncbi:MAG: beta strand repeat-containing protein, partial [Fimbriiglobus sp.]
MPTISLSRFGPRWLGLVLLTLFGSSNLQAQQYFWNVSSGSASFHTAANWVDGGNVVYGVAPTSTSDVFIQNSGTYTVNYTTSSTIQSLTLNNATATVSHTGGTLTVNNGGFTLTSGTYVLGTAGTLEIQGSGGTFNNTGGTFQLNSGGTLRVRRPVTSANLGTFSRASQTAGTFEIADTSLTLSGNYDIGTVGNVGSINLTGNAVLFGNGNSILNTSGSAARLLGPDNSSFNPRLDNVFVGTNVLSFPGNSEFELTNGVTFAPGSSYTMASFSFLQIGVGQTSLADLSLQGTGQFSIAGTVNSTTWTIASSTSIQNTSGSFGYIGSIGSGSTGTARSIDNNGTVWNSGTGTTVIEPSGTFDNKAGGLLKVTNGVLAIRPGTFNNSAGTIEIGASGRVRFERPVTTAQLGTFNRATPTTGVLEINNTNLTLSSNYDIGTAGNTGTIGLSLGAAVIGGGNSITNASNSTARLFAWESASHNPRLDNVSIGNNVLAFPSNSEFELT